MFGYPHFAAAAVPVTTTPPGKLTVRSTTTLEVLNVTAVAGSFAEAQRLSRETAEAIRFEGKIYRRDIGWREVVRERSDAE